MLKSAAAFLGLLTFTSPVLAQSFTSFVIDQNAGDCKMLADINGDGYLDAVLGGMAGSEDLHWYAYPNWTKTKIADANREFTTDGDVADIDGDGDIDVIIPDGPSGNNLLWFENPRIGSNTSWTRNAIGAGGTWIKDVQCQDYDQDGDMDVVARTANTCYFYRQGPGGTWSRSVVASGLSGEGLTSGDVDGDQFPDVVLKIEWAEWNGSGWSYTPFNFSPPNTFKAFIADINDDGVNDIAFSNSEGTSAVVWYDQANNWSSNTIASSINRCHTLQIFDMDLDGHLDVVTGQMHTSADDELVVWYGDGGSTWTKFLVNDTFGIHNGVVGDIDADGDYDIYGSNWTGNNPVRWYENNLDPVSGPCSEFDLTTTGAGIGDPGFGVPDGFITGADINYFVNFWVIDDVSIADLTTQGAGIGDPGYGEPDGLVTGTDINYYVNGWVFGCP